MSTKFKELVNHTKLFAIGSIGSKLIVFLMIPVYARVFTQAEFGTVDIFQTSLQLLIPLITIEMIQAVFRFSMQNTDHEYSLLKLQQVFTTSLLFSLSAMSIFAILFYFIPIFSEYKDYKVLFILVLFSQVTLQIIKGFYQGTKEIKKFIILEFIQVISFVVLNIIFLVIYDFGVLGLFFAIFISQIFPIIYTLLAYRLHHYFSYKELDLTMFKEMAVYSMPLIPNTMLAWVIASSDRYMLMYMDDISSVGIYAMAIKIPLVVLLVFGIFLQAWQIGLTKNFSEKDLTIFVSKVFSTISSLLIILVSLLILINKPLLSLVLSEEFYSAWMFVPWLLLAVLFQSFSSFLGVGYIASKKTKGAMYTTIVAASLNFILNIILIPTYAIYGVVFATLISYFVLFLIRTKATKQFFHIQYQHLILFSSILILLAQAIISIENDYYEYIINSILLLILLILNRHVLKIESFKSILNLKKEKHENR